MNNIIEVKNLSKSYGNVKAVKDISFDVKEGQLFAFLGLNGAGKSTTINIICGILSKDSGEVLVNGANLDHEPMKIKREIGIVFQNSALDKQLSVYDNLRIKAALYGVKGIEFKNCLYSLSQLMDLQPIMKRPLGKLSGGQRRKVDIARALLHQPKILILDEPTTGLDPQTRQMVWSTLENLQKNRGLTVFLTTHYMEEAASADDVIILNEGTIVAQGTPNQLKNKYAKDYIRVYDVQAAAKEMAEAESLNYSQKGTYVEIEIDSTRDAKELIRRYGDTFKDFEIIKGTMDDVFLKATGKQLNADEGDEENE